ncbi:MAG: ferrous iron transport protein A [Rhodospirillales bacterium]|nr:ferrous iron transport protein A [Rhodospirillales bacterium]
MDACGINVATFPLILAAEGERVRIVALGEGRGLNRKLADLGLTVGYEVVIVRNDGAGPMVIARDDMRLALGAGIAHRVLVCRTMEG